MTVEKLDDGDPAVAVRHQVVIDGVDPHFGVDRDGLRNGLAGVEYVLQPESAFEERPLVRLRALGFDQRHGAQAQTPFVHARPRELVAQQRKGDACVARGPFGQSPGGAGLIAGFDDPAFVDQDHAVIVDVAVVVAAKDDLAVIVESQRRAMLVRRDRFRGRWRECEISRDAGDDDGGELYFVHGSPFSGLYVWIFDWLPLNEMVFRRQPCQVIH